jgi:hypothetical protein
MAGSRIVLAGALALALAGCARGPIDTGQGFGGTPGGLGGSAGRRAPRASALEA